MRREKPVMKTDMNESLEYAHRQSQIYYEGTEVPRDMEQAIRWQKQYRDLCRKECSDPEDDLIIPLITAEYELAQMELADDRLKDARNSCWRALYLCRDQGHYRFYSDKRIPYYAEIYMLLGDVFLKRGDSEQAYECYERDMDLYRKLTEQFPDDPDILKNASRCFLKYDDRYYGTAKHYVTDPHYSIFEQHLRKCLDVCPAPETYRMLGTILLRRGDLADRTHSELFYISALEFFRSVPEADQIPESYSGMVLAYLRLAECRSQNNDLLKDPLFDYYAQKAYETCGESKSFADSETVLNDYLAYFKLMGSRMRENSTPDEKQRTAYKNLYQEAKTVTGKLMREYPGEHAEWESGPIHAYFAELCPEETARQALSVLKVLVQNDVAKRFRDYSYFKRIMMYYGKLDEKEVSDFIPFTVFRTGGHGRCLYVSNRNEPEILELIFEEDQPSGNVLCAYVEENVILGWREGKLSKRISVISGDPVPCDITERICMADNKKLSECMRPDPTPDEFIYLDVLNGDTVCKQKYVRVYG